MRRYWGMAVLVAALGCGDAASGGFGTTAADVPGADNSSSADAAPDDSVAVADSSAVDSSRGRSADLATDDSAAPPEDVAVVEPCGNTAGKVMCNLEEQGYIRNEITGLATSAEFSPSYTLAEVMAKSTQKYAVILLGAWW